MTLQKGGIHKKGQKDKVYYGRLVLKRIIDLLYLKEGRDSEVPSKTERKGKEKMYKEEISINPKIEERGRSNVKITSAPEVET